MDAPSREDLHTLISDSQAPCVSMFMPMNRGGAETMENPTRFKNLLRQAEKRLLAEGSRQIEVKALVKPAEALLQDRLFWQHQADGLAAFLSPGGFRHYRVPLALAELLVVAPRFHVKPLLPLLGDGRFHVLALSQKGVRLLECTRYTCSEARPYTLPRNLADALQYDTPERQLQSHTVMPRRASGSALFHGHGAGEDDAKANLSQYFHQIDKGLRDYLRGRQAPLLLAGVHYLLPLYREANTYSLLVDEELDGNFDGAGADELHRRALTAMAPYFEKGQREAAAQYRRLAGTDRASRRLRKIIPAAHQGRVGQLFVALDVQRWGTFAPETDELRLRDAPAAGDEDLLNLAAVQALLNGGAVYAVPQDKMPDDAPLAAVFRY